MAFFAINWLGRHTIASGYFQISFVADADDAPAFNTIFRILAPLVFSVVSAAVLYAVGRDEWVFQFHHVTILYFGIRWSINVLVGRLLLLHWPRQIFIASVSIAGAFALYDRVLRFRKNLLPDPQNLANELWVIILLFLYSTFNGVEWAIGPTSSDRRKSYIGSKYREYSSKFGRIVRANAPSMLLEAACYAILIYESFNRPPVYQWLERYVLYPFGASKTFGPMQVESYGPISDQQSVLRGVLRIVGSADEVNAEIRQLLSQYGQFSADQAIPKHYYSMFIEGIAKRYNVRSDYPSAVSSIYAVLVEMHYHDLRSDSVREDGAG